MPLAAAAVDLALVDQRLHDFFDEERIALGLPEDGGAELVAHRLLTEQHREQAIGVLAREPAERDAGGEALAIPVDERARERMPAIELDLAVRAEREEAVAGEMPKQVVQQRERPLIRPLEVVGEEEEAAPRGEPLEEARDVVEEPQALLGRRERSGSRHRPEAIGQLGRQLRELGGVLADQLAQRGLGLGVHPQAQSLDERQVRSRRFVLVAAAAQHDRARDLRLHDQLAREPRLPRARLARNECEVPDRLQRAIPEGTELCELGLAADEPAAHELFELARVAIAGARHRLRRRRVGDLHRRERLVDGGRGLTRGGVTLGRRLREQPEDRALERRREVGTERARRRDRRVHVLRDDRERVVTVERQSAGDQLVEHDAERIEIGAAVDRLTERLLGREVRGGADDETLVRHAARCAREGESEVGDLVDRQRRRLGDQHVRRFQVAMDDAVLMRVLERREQLERQPRDAVEVARRACAEIAAVHELHDEERRRAVTADVVDRDESRVVERRRRARLVQQARLLGDLDRAEHLHRDVPAELEIVSAEHFAHRAATEWSVEAVAGGERVTEGDRGGEGHGVGAREGTGGPHSSARPREGKPRPPGTGRSGEVRERELA